MICPSSDRASRTIRALFGMRSPPRHGQLASPQGGRAKARSRVSCYSESRFLRVFFTATGIAARVRASSASLASLKARRHSIFLRSAMACCSISAIARALLPRRHVAVRRARCLRERVQWTFWRPSSPSRFAIKEGPLNPRIEWPHRHFSTSVKWRERLKPATGFPRLLCPASYQS